MADFLTTKQALAAIERVIDGASQRLTLLSPYQRIGDTFRARIEDAARRGVEVTIVYGDQDSELEPILNLSRLPKTRVLYAPRLHAKCYANESEMVITSLNLLVSSEQNWEMGVRVVAPDTAYTAATREIDLICRNSTDRGRAKLTSTKVVNEAQRLARTGYCIRCRTSIPSDTTRPLCGQCFESWRQWENASYPERYCHACGREDLTTFSMPRCDGCFYGAAGF